MRNYIFYIFLLPPTHRQAPFPSSLSTSVQPHHSTHGRLTRVAITASPLSPRGAAWPTGELRLIRSVSSGRRRIGRRHGWRALTGVAEELRAAQIGGRRSHRALVGADREEAPLVRAARWSCLGSDAVDPDSGAPRSPIGSSSPPPHRLLATAPLILPSIAIARVVGARGEHGWGIRETTEDLHNTAPHLSPHTARPRWR
jgi:hypothetical protein